MLLTMLFCLLCLRFIRGLLVCCCARPFTLLALALAQAQDDEAAACAPDCEIVYASDWH